MNHFILHMQYFAVDVICVDVLDVKKINVLK